MPIVMSRERAPELAYGLGLDVTLAGPPDFFTSVGQAVEQLFPGTSTGVVVTEDPVGVEEFHKTAEELQKEEAAKTFDWTMFLDNVAKAADIGTAVATAGITTDIQQAQLEVARTQAAATATQARAAELAAQTRLLQEQAREPAAVIIDKETTGISLGLVGGGAALLGLAYVLSKRKKRRGR